MKTKKVYVFDFDKTLTQKDTINGFYLSLSKYNLFFFLKCFVYLIVMLFVKFKILSNSFLKQIGVFFFLKGLSKDEIEVFSKSYAKKIKFNNLYYNFNFKRTDLDIYIVSASYEIYLNKIFPENVKIIGSQLNFNNGYINKLKFNNYAESKLLSLKKQNIIKIDALYTDSINDLALAKISEKIYVVFKESITEFTDLRDFKNYFKK